MSTRQFIPLKRATGTLLSFTPAHSGLLQRKCACGGAPGPTGECEACKKKRLGLQTKLKINEPGDAYEQEADRIANQVMATSAHLAVGGTPPRIQRFSGESSQQMEAAPASVDRVIASPGRPLEPALRQDMEQRFSYDFSRVRVHTGAVAEQSAREINANAYAAGHNVAFGAGRFAPGTHEGRYLIAHELTHVVQQSGQLQRAVSPTSACPANAHGAPASPLAALGAANARAVLMALGTSRLLFSESLFIRAGEPPSSTFNAYVHRFGPPSAVGHKFRNRFTNHLENTLVLAEGKEMEFLATRMAGVSKFLGRNIRFKCTGTSHTTIGACAHHCKPGNALASCASGHHHEMAVCQGFWGLGAPDQQAIGMIHEVGHMVHHFGDHDVPPFANTSAKRILEPECYASMVADIYGIAPFDPSCP
jgi:hypothetical protein